MTQIETLRSIDWQQLALNLRGHRPLVQISVELGMSPGYMGQVSRGEVKEPGYALGVMLLDMHYDLCGATKHRRLLT
jgi:hypothetical protein